MKIRALVIGSFLFCTACVPAPSDRGMAPSPLIVDQAGTVGLLQRIRLDPGTEPTPEMVQEMARKAREDMEQMFSGARKEQKWLGLSVGVGNFLVRTGQYAGGGGAAIFGLNAAGAETTDDAQNAGRNAGYAGAVAAGVTLLEQLFNLDEKRARERECRQLDVQKMALVSATRGWEYNRNDPAFRRTFLEAHYNPLIERATDLYGKCMVGAS